MGTPPLSPPLNTQHHTPESWQCFLTKGWPPQGAEPLIAGDKKHATAGPAQTELVPHSWAFCAEPWAALKLLLQGSPVPFCLHCTALLHPSESKARWPTRCKLLVHLSSPQKRSMNCEIMFQFKSLLWFVGLFIFHLLVDGIHYCCCYLHMFYTYPKRGTGLRSVPWIDNGKQCDLHGIFHFSAVSEKLYLVLR